MACDLPSNVLINVLKLMYCSYKSGRDTLMEGPKNLCSASTLEQNEDVVPSPLDSFKRASLCVQHDCLLGRGLSYLDHHG
jgi:hypothetical protein